MHAEDIKISGKTVSWTYDAKDIRISEVRRVQSV